VYGFAIVFMMSCGVLAYHGGGPRNFETAACVPEPPHKARLIISVLLISIFFGVMAGVRWNVGVDYTGYFDLYAGARNVATWFQRDFEYLFAAITKMFSYSGLHFFFFFAMWAFIQIALLLLTFRKECWLFPWLIFVLMANGEYFMWMNGIRQCVAAMILLYSTEFIQKRQLLPFLGCVALALGFHQSAVVMLPFYYILNAKTDVLKFRTVQVVLLALAVYADYTYLWQAWTDKIEYLLAFLGYGTRYGNLESRMDIWTDDLDRSYRYFFLLALNLVIIILSPKLKAYYRETRFKMFYLMYFIGVVGYYLGYQNRLLNRFFLYFISYQVVIGAYALNYLWNMRKRKSTAMLIGVMAVLYLLILGLYIWSNTATQFKFFWSYI